jgi:hypothetical protein
VAPATYTITVGMPSLSSPTNQALGESTTPTLTWQAATDATSCTVCPDMSGPPQQHYTASGTSFTPGAALQGGDIHYWDMAGNSGSASGPASASTPKEGGIGEIRPITD